MDYSPPDSSVHGILQARIPAWVAISYSRESSWPRDWTCNSCVSCIDGQVPYHCATWEAFIWLLLLLSHFSRVRLCATPETAAHQAPLSLGFSKQEHWSGLPFPSPMQKSEKWKWSRSVVSNSSRPHGLQPTRLFRPWDFPGKSTGVGCHCLLRSPGYLSSNTQSVFYRRINLLSLISMVRHNKRLETLKNCFIPLLHNLPISFKKGSSVSNVIYLHHTHTHTHTHPSSLNNLESSSKNNQGILTRQAWLLSRWQAS